MRYFLFLILLIETSIAKGQEKVYTPPIKVDPISNALAETSGLQWAGNSLWSFNDGGNGAVLYRIDTASNAILQTINLEGATNIDWEDIAFDGTHFYIGDFGNNANGARADLKIYKFPLGAIPDYAGNPTVTIPSSQIAVINFSYSDQPQPLEATTFNRTKFDCEAMLVDGQKIHLFSKNWIDATTTHYVIDAVTAGSYSAVPLETLATGYLVTAADKVPGASTIVLIGYQNSGFGEHFIHLLSEFSGGLFFNGNRRLVKLPNAAEIGQAEGIAFRNAAYGYISNEKFVRTVFGFTVTVNQKLRSFSVADFPLAVVLPLELKSFTAINRKDANEINWLFADPAKEVSIEYSKNKTDFVTVHKAKTSVGGSFLHHAPTGLAYYRLAWKGATGNILYSSIVSVRNNAVSGLSNVLLRSNGQLSFMLNGDAVSDCAFRLLTTDGKLVAQRKLSMLTPGLNQLSFSQHLSSDIFLLYFSNEASSRSHFLKVE